MIQNRLQQIINQIIQTSPTFKKRADLMYSVATGTMPNPISSMLINFWLEVKYVFEELLEKKEFSKTGIEKFRIMMEGDYNEENDLVTISLNFYKFSEHTLKAKSIASYSLIIDIDLDIFEEIDFVSDNEYLMEIGFYEDTLKTLIIYVADKFKGGKEND